MQMGMNLCAKQYNADDMQINEVWGGCLNECFAWTDRNFKMIFGYFNDTHFNLLIALPTLF